MDQINGQQACGNPHKSQKYSSKQSANGRKPLYKAGFLTLLTLVSLGAMAETPATERNTLPPPDAEVKTLYLYVSQDRYPLDNYIEILEDKTGEMTIEEVSSSGCAGDFERPATLNLGISSSVYWVRFSVGAPSLAWTEQMMRSEWLLDIDWWNISLAQLYIPESNEGRPTGAAEQNTLPSPATEQNTLPSPEWIVQEAGVPDGTAPKQSLRKTLVFRLPMDLQEPRTCYLRVASQTVLFLPMEISTAEAYLNKIKRRTLGLGIYYGLILAMVVYNAVLYFSLRDRNYFWYVLYVSFLGLYFLGINGLLHEYVLPDLSGGVLVRLDLSFLGVALLGTGLFTRSFLMTRRNAPVADKFLLFYTALAGILVAFSPFAGASTVRFYATFGLVATFIPIGAGLICWKRGFRPARFFLLAWGLFTLSGIIYALTWRGMLPFTVWNLHSFQVGSAVEAVILSLALGDRVRILRWEREEARRQERRYMELAITDALTSLFNARYFHSHIGPEIQRSESLDRPLALLMIDVDNFKEYNDTYGHPEGDKVLSTLGQVILSSVRDNDLPCRYGGEEFAVILPGSTGPIAVDIAERIRSAFEKTVFVPRAEESIHVTISTGVAEHVVGQEFAQFVERADKALYEAKRTGKNRIVLADA